MIRHLFGRLRRHRGPKPTPRALVAPRPPIEPSLTPEEKRAMQLENARIWVLLADLDSLLRATADPN